MLTTDQLLHNSSRDPLARYAVAAEQLQRGVVGVVVDGDDIERYFWDVKRFTRHILQLAREAGWEDEKEGLTSDLIFRCPRCGSDAFIAKLSPPLRGCVCPDCGYNG